MNNSDGTSGFMIPISAQQRRRATEAPHAYFISPVPASTWSQVVAEDPAATVYQTRAWFEAALHVGKASDVSRLYVTDEGRRLILPMLRRKPFPGVTLDDGYPNRLGSAGLLASGGLKAEDVSPVLRDLVAARSTSTRIKGNFDTVGVWLAGLVPGVQSRLQRVEVLDLDGGFKRVWGERFQSSARRAIRKAERSGLVVERDSAAQVVRDFYELYLEWTNRRAAKSGLPRAVAAGLARRREPLSLFETAARLLGDDCRIWLARYQGEPVAGLISLVHGRHAFYWRGYSRKELAGPLRANNLLQRLAIEDACDSGCRFYSMGQSGGVASLEHFKQTMGATPRDAVECRIERLPLSRAAAVMDSTQATAARLMSVRPRPGRRRATRSPGAP